MRINFRPHNPSKPIQKLGKTIEQNQKTAFHAVGSTIGSVSDAVATVSEVTTEVAVGVILVANPLNWRIC